MSNLKNAMTKSLSVFPPNISSKFTSYTWNNSPDIAASKILKHTGLAGQDLLQKTE